MQDAIRPSAEAARAMYQRGYQTWFNLRELALNDNQLTGDCLVYLQTAFPDHPHFPVNLKAHVSPRNALVYGQSTWVATCNPHHLPPFQQEAIFQVAWDKPTPVILTSDLKHTTTILPEIYGREQNHIPILIQAWAYILSARWAELIDGADISYSSQYSGSKAPATNEGSISVYIGHVGEDAARWWSAILSDTTGWEATMRASGGGVLYSPWSTKLTSEHPFVMSTKIKAMGSATSDTPATSTTAYSYLSEYCHLHGIDDQKQAALAATLLIPVAKYDHTPINLAIPRLHHEQDSEQEQGPCSRIILEDKLQIDRLVTLSCNPRGAKALLNSVFFEPDVTSNICGIWLQGSLAFLNSVRNPHVLLRTLIKRDPGVGALWLGAFVTGTYHKSLREARAAWWPVDLNSAAWTRTFMSFIQAPVAVPASGIQALSRADECRLLYLCHDVDYSIPPLFPFAPFGSTALADTNLDVHEHALCGTDHCLGYASFTWTCVGGMVEQRKHDAPLTMVRSKSGPSAGGDDHANVDCDDVDSEDENSEMVTRNVFTWLRGQDGFPVAERAIREHEWIDNLEDDDDGGPIEGGVRSTVGGTLNGWILKTSTHRSNSM